MYTQPPAHDIFNHLQNVFYRPRGGNADDSRNNAVHDIQTADQHDRVEISEETRQKVMESFARRDTPNAAGVIAHHAGIFRERLKSLERESYQAGYSSGNPCGLIIK